MASVLQEAHVGHLDNPWTTAAYATVYQEAERGGMNGPCPRCGKPIEGGPRRRVCIACRAKEKEPKPKPLAPASAPPPPAVPKTHKQIVRVQRSHMAAGRTCRFCFVGDDQAGWSTTAGECMACHRQRQRAGKCEVHQVLKLRSFSSGRPGSTALSYCPLCPGKGMISVVLVHPTTGEERTVYVSLKLKILNRGRVFDAPSDRAWRLGRPWRVQERPDPTFLQPVPNKATKEELIEIYRIRAEANCDLFTGEPLEDRDYE